MAKFIVGDQVRLSKISSLAFDHFDLLKHNGTVTAIVDDQTLGERVSIAYNGVELFKGIDAGHFEKASV